jgi:hypothetical protein
MYRVALTFVHSSAAAAAHQAIALGFAVEIRGPLVRH